MHGRVQGPNPPLPVLFLGRGGAIDGQQRQLLYLADGLARRSFNLTTALSEPGAVLEELRARGIDGRVARMSSWRSPFRVIRRYVDAYRLLRLAREKGVQIVHAHDVWRTEYARFIAKRLSIPYVVHIRGPLSPRDIRKHHLGQADALIAIADRYVDDLISAGIDPDRIRLIDDGVDTTLFAPARADPDFIRRQFGIVGSPLVGLVGRISPFKRICEFLRIIAALPAGIIRSACFVIVGDWVDPDYGRQVKQAVAHHRLESRVQFIGRCDSHLMPNVLSSLDVLVTLSGGSIMFEAMAMQRAVLSIRADGRHSKHTRHGQTAWCISGDEPAVAAHALTQLLEDATLRDLLGDAGRNWVEQHLSAQQMVAKVETLYGSLLLEPLSRPAVIPADPGLGPGESRNP